MSKLNRYTLLGNTGLRVSPLCLGTMTFGTEWGWGAPLDTAKQIFNTYLEAGGNFIDTADMYTNGTSEEMIGQFVAERKVRDQVVLATKYTFNAQAGNPNAGGNGRKNMMRALEGSLKKLKTDYVDLYWMHAWDTFTPVEEVITTMDALVKSGKVRYIGLSDCPAWYVSRAQTIAELRGLEKVSAIQMEYNLTERTIEHEYMPMAQELGIGICAWSPLAGGLLSGKYKKDTLGEGRLKTARDSGNPIMERFTKNPKNWEIAEAVTAIAKELGHSPAQVALNWIGTRPGVTSTLIGATKLNQLQDNLGALDFEIPENFSKKLEEISTPALPTPYMFFGTQMAARFSGGTVISR